MNLNHRIRIAFLCVALFFCAACSPAADITPTPTLEITPILTPEITSAPTLEIAPTLTPEITPAPTLDIAPTPTLEVTPAPTPKVTPAPTNTPAPTPDPTPAPTTPTLASWETDPGQFILDILNAGFSDGRLGVRIVNNASGPISTSVLDNECGQKIRDLFSSYDWKVMQSSEGESAPFGRFAVQIHDSGTPYDISFSTGSNVLSVVQEGKVMVHLYFSANGAENLSKNLVALCPYPAAQLVLVSSPAQETREDTAQKFMENFFAIMLRNGHIADYELIQLNTLDENTDDSGAITFDVHFRLKAAHPELDIWSEGANSYSVNKSGWTNTIKWKVCLVSDSKGEIYRLDWLD